MALSVKGLEGNELADDYIRKSVPKGRWSDTWDVLKSNFLKLILLNVFVLITFVPGVVVMYFRNAYVSGLGMVYPFNPSITYPFYPDLIGLNESVNLSADLLFFSLLIVAGFFASIGIAGASYSVRRMLATHGEFSIKSFFHGIKVCYFNTVIPVTLFMAFLFATVIIGDWKDLAFAVGSNKAGSVTAYVFIIIATVLVGVYSAWLFAVGTSYRVSFAQLFRNAFVLIIGTPFQTVFMSAFTLIPVWFFMAGGILRTISYILFIFFGFSFMILCWTAFTQWAFDLYVNPNLKAAEEAAKANKSEKELAQEKLENDKSTARELLAAGRSELIARPIMPIGKEPAMQIPSLTFTRADIVGAEQSRVKLGEEVSSYEKQHQNDPVYAEYNKLFAEREKALQTDDKKKGKKAKKISSDNLLK
ncbi:MAG: hypothetical protein HDP34_01375 [Clostridia bacterium]|nr:hypothetical protein [Clostridia bacterium]